MFSGMQDELEQRREKFEEMCAANSRWVNSAVALAERLLFLEKHGKRRWLARELEFLKAYKEYLRTVEEL